MNAIEMHENRLAIITAIGIEVHALVLDERTDEIVSTANPQADKLVYARAFQAWAEGRIEGEAEEIFESVEEALES